MTAGTRNLAASLLLSSSPFAAAAQEQGVGYPSVAAALEALRARSDVSVVDRAGWTLIDDRPNRTLWSFTSPGHPAHPAVIKRRVFERDGKLGVTTQVLCEAGKAACDRLADEPTLLGPRMAAEARPESSAASPSKPEAAAPSKPGGAAPSNPGATAPARP